MSNYQMCRAVKLTINDDTNRWRLPEDDRFWDHLLDFLHCKFDPGVTNHALVAQRTLPGFLYPQTHGLVSEDTPSWTQEGVEVSGHTALLDRYWICSFARCEFFWRELWRAGNRGRVVFEFQAEAGDEDCYLPGDGGGFYVVTVDLDEDGPRSVTHDDDPRFYTRVHDLCEMACEEALADAGVERAEDLDEGRFYWSARDHVSPYYMHQRYDLLSCTEEDLTVMSRGFYTS